MIPMHREEIASRIAYAQHRRYNATLNRTDVSLLDEGSVISEGLARRLAHYARKRLTEAGWGNLLAGCEVHVSGNSPCGTSPEDMTYQVEFKNPEGNAVGVQGILTLRGWPKIDHGLFIEG